MFNILCIFDSIFSYLILWFPNILVMQSESAQGEAAASAMGGRGRGAGFPGRGRGMRRR
jgi:hypothetical protein